MIRFLLLLVLHSFHSDVRCHGWNGRRPFSYSSSSSRGGGFVVNDINNNNGYFSRSNKTPKKKKKKSNNNDEFQLQQQPKDSSSLIYTSSLSLSDQECISEEVKNENSQNRTDDDTTVKPLEQMNVTDDVNSISGATSDRDEVWDKQLVTTSLSAHSSNLKEQPLPSIEEGTKRTSSSYVVLGTGIGLLSTCTGLAKLGILPGMSVINDDGILSYIPYTNNEIVQDVSVTIITTLLAYVFVKINTFSVAIGKLEPRDARKLIHTFSAPLFILLWPFFTETLGSRLFAAIVPILNAIRLYLAATNEDDINKTKNNNNNDNKNDITLSSSSTTTSSTGVESELAIAVSRSGEASEALGGPFIYVLILLASVLLFWKDNPTAILAISCMAAGDGTADLIGRRFGTIKWPNYINEKKSIAGSLAFFVSSTMTAFGLILWMQHFDCFTLPAISELDLIVRVAFISFVTAILEVVPFKGFDDNYTVPISAAILSMLFL